MPFDILKALPPDAEDPVAQLRHSRDGRVDIPAEIHLANAELRIMLLPQSSCRRQIGTPGDRVKSRVFGIVSQSR